MATTIRGSSSASDTTGTAISVTKPTDTATGDVVLCSIHANGQTTIVDNNGGTPFTVTNVDDYKPNTGSGHTVSFFYRIIVDGDPASYAFTSGASGRWSIVAITLTDLDTSDIFDIAPLTANAVNDDNADDADIPVPSITTGSDNSIHFVGGYWDTSNFTGLSTPAGYANVENIGDQPQAWCQKTITPAGATGIQTYSSNEVTARLGYSFAVKLTSPATGSHIFGDEGIITGTT